MLKAQEISGSVKTEHGKRVILSGAIPAPASKNKNPSMARLKTT